MTTEKRKEIENMYDVKSLKADEFISDEEIRETLAYADANKDNMEVIDAIIAKAKCVYFPFNHIKSLDDEIS